MGRVGSILGLCMLHSGLCGPCGVCRAAETPETRPIPPVIVTEIHYHPPGDAGLEEEFLELHNRTDAKVDLHGWAFTDGIDFRFDRNSGPASISPKGFLVLARNRAAVARLTGIPEARIAGPYTGRLSNFRDRLELTDASGNVVEAIEYSQDGAWPARADGLGSSLQRISSDAPGDLPQNWAVDVTEAPARGERRSRGILDRLLERLRGESARSAREATSAITPGRPSSVASAAVPPLVTSIERVPEQPRPREAVTIRARVEGAVVESVTLWYDAGAGEQSLRLVDSGRVSGQPAQGRIYAGEIPPAPDGTVVRYRIVARSVAGSSFHFPRKGNPSARLGYYVLDRPREENDDLEVYHLLWNGPLSCEKGVWLPGCTFVHRGTAYLNVGLKYRGLTSCGRPKSGLKVEFNRGALFRGQDQLNLLGGWQDRSLLREKLAWDLFRDIGHPHCEAKMASVYARGNEFHGLFVALEEPGSRYLRRNGLDDRVLWKCHTSFLGLENSKSRTYEKRNRREEGSDRSAIVELERELISLEGRQLREYVLRHIDVEALIEYQAVKCLVSDEDGYSKNWFLCQETEQAPGGRITHRWSVHPWDLDLSFGQYSLYKEEIHTDRHPLAGTADHPRHGSHGLRWNGLLEAVFGRRSEDYFIKALYGRIWGLLEKTFDPDRLGEKIDRLDVHTIDAARADLERVPRWGADGRNVEVHRERLRRYVSARYAFLRGFLTSEQRTTASEVGPWEPHPRPRVAVGIAPPRALAFRTFRYVPAPRLRITEIHYHPAQDDELEFIEIRNLEPREIDISGWNLPAVGFTFPEDSRVRARDAIVVARDPARLRARYDGLSRPRLFGPYPGRLSNGGEDLRLRDSGHHGGRRYFPETIDGVKYRDRPPWPEDADGRGRSLELRDLSLDNDLPESWRASREPGGSPGR